jgi:FkbM family methyltransferase
MNGNIDRLSYAASLVLLQRRGWTAKTFLDIGAAEGTFLLARRDFGLFPEAKHFFFDAMRENEPIYQALEQRPAGPFQVIGHEIAALSCMEGETVISVDPSFYNTHITGLQPALTYAELRQVPVRRLDTLVDKHKIEPPYAIKLDVQGGELDVLRGALLTLEKAVVVVTEIRTFAERDALDDLLVFMNRNGFTLFDLTDLAHFPSDHSLYQCYATFIPKRMEFRFNQPHAAPEQESGVVENLKLRRDTMIKRLLGQ